MWRTSALAALTVWSLTSSLSAETLTGEIFTSGNPANRKTEIKPSASSESITICPRNREFQIRQLAGTITSVTGTTVDTKSPAKSCFDVTDFEILEIARGRPAIVGVLKMIAKNEFAIVNKSGKSWRLAKLPPGLKTEVNHVLVMDLVSSTSFLSEPTWLVARAFRMPTP